MATVLISELAKCEPEFKNLTVKIVEMAFSTKEAKRPSDYTVAAELTREVTAFKVDPKTPVRKLAHRFEEATRAERKRTK